MISSAFTGKTLETQLVHHWTCLSCWFAIILFLTWCFSPQSWWKTCLALCHFIESCFVFFIESFWGRKERKQRSHSYLRPLAEQRQWIDVFTKLKPALLFWLFRMPFFQRCLKTCWLKLRVGRVWKKTPGTVSAGLWWNPTPELFE